MVNTAYSLKLHSHICFTVLRLLVFIAACVLVSITNIQSTWAATLEFGITLTTDNESIYLGDTVVVEIETVGLLEDIDTAALFKDADLLRETYGTRIAVIDGRVAEVKIRRMEFLPRSEGISTFGPLYGETTAGETISNSLSVDVLPAANIDWQPANDDLQIQVLLSRGDQSTAAAELTSPYEVYIGERIVVDITLRHYHAIADEQIRMPDFEGFDVLKAYELRRTTEDSIKDVANESGATQEPGNIRVTAWRYHVFAQRSGPYSIGNISWSGEAIRSRTQRARFSRESDAIPLDIKPAIQGKDWWLPASSVLLEEQWSKDTRELSAGDELFRTITLSARDVLASHLPDVVPLQSRAISSTLVEQERTQILQADHIEATATFKFRLVAQSPIPVFLDTVRVPWFNTRDAQEREAIIPARRINVGLPDRADLLADLALSVHWFDRFKLEARSFGNRFAYWHVLLVLLCFISFGLLCQEAFLAIRRKNTRKAFRGTSSLPPL